ncbi:MAG TPA: hypothetical protein VF533_13280 [Solirubrobacteraceae bacterium]|jgi:hypothetical protein
MAATVAEAFLDALGDQEPGARRALRALRPSAGGDERARALQLAAFAVREWLGQALEISTTEHPDLVPRTGRRIDEFAELPDEAAAREAGRFALAVADLARQARADDVHDLALHAGLAAVAAADGDWPLAGRRAALAAHALGGGAIEAPIEAEAALRAIGAL